MILEKKSFSIFTLCRNLHKIYQTRAALKNITVNLEIDPQCPEWIVGDEVRNTQILHNLLSNAVKFTSHGEINLRVSVVTLKKSYVELQFVISDTGIGIEENKKRIIFEEFIQAENDHTRKYGGTGLGLAISRRLIELQHGRLRVDSTVGKGSVFSYVVAFTLPDSRPLIKPEIDVAIKQKFKGQHILLVEDNEINIQVTKKFLERWGLSVDIAADGLEAIKKVQEKTYDLILMDLHMPVMGGIEATRIIRTFNSVVPIMGLSADVMNDYVLESESYGMNDFITKPYVQDVFLKKLHRLLSGAPD